MGKYEIALSALQEDALGKIAVKKGVSKEEMLVEIVNLLLDERHTMKQEDIEKSYAECKEIYLSWSEKGTD